MTEAERAERMEILSKRLLTAIATFDPACDVAVLTGSLGVVCGTLALATGVPDKFMGAVNALATGVITGNLLNPT